MIYRLHISNLSEASLGFEFFGSKREATIRMVELRRENKDNDDDLELTLDSRPTPTSKAEVIAMLHIWGGHPHNG